jgi:hypothetical protein
MAQDDIRVNFLLALERAKVTLTAWEAGFVDSCLGQFSFSRKQAASIDRMIAKYSDKVTVNGIKKRAVPDVELEAKEVMPEPSVAVRQYLAAGVARRFTLWNYLLPSEQQALTKAGKQ